MNRTKRKMLKLRVRIASSIAPKPRLHKVYTKYNELKPIRA